MPPERATKICLESGKSLRRLARPRHRLRWCLAELEAVAVGEISHVPKAEGERASLDGLGSGKKLPSHQPQASQPQIPVQAHAPVSQHSVMDGTDRYAQLLCKLRAVDRLSDIVGEQLANVLKDLELPSRVRARSPFHFDH